MYIANVVEPEFARSEDSLLEKIEIVVWGNPPENPRMTCASRSMSMGTLLYMPDVFGIFGVQRSTIMFDIMCKYMTSQRSANDM